MDPNNMVGEQNNEALGVAVPEAQSNDGALGSEVPAKKSGKGMMIAVILSVLVAVGGIGFGVWAMMAGNNQKDELEKDYKNKIGILEQQNEKLTEKLSEASKDNGGDTVINIDMDKHENPIVDVSGGNGQISTVYYELGDGSGRMVFGITNGKITYCTNGSNERCEVSGILGSVYKVVLFGGPTQDRYGKVGFIMQDGTVEYASYSDALEKNNFAIEGVLKTEKTVLDILDVGVGPDGSDGVTAGGFRISVLVYSDGTYGVFREAML